MTGPEHYRLAEATIRLVDQAQDFRHGLTDKNPGVPVSELLAEAQVHATLALVAATALTDTDRSIGKAGVAWREVVS